MEQKYAKQIVAKLQEHGYQALYAGGWVRDFLLGHPSEDIDIATNAPPEKIQELFKKTLPLGIAFGIVLVIIKNHQYEVATFRKDLEYRDGRHPSEVVFSSISEDAKRRDFTINGMYYDPIEEKVIDLVEGEKDLKSKILRAIGDPKQRFTEDRLRLIRAVRLANRLHFTIESSTKKAIEEEAGHLFPSVSVERVWQEFYKMEADNTLQDCLISLWNFGLLPVIFPLLKDYSLKKLKKNVRRLSLFPKKAPLISKILELLPLNSKKDAIFLCKEFKLSNTDKDFTESLFETKDFLKIKAHDRYDWAHFYAVPNHFLCLQIYASRLCFLKRWLFLFLHRKREKKLHHWIERIKNKKPLITNL